MKNVSSGHPAKRIMALLLAMIMTIGLMPSALTVEAAQADFGFNFESAFSAEPEYAPLCCRPAEALAHIHPVFAPPELMSLSTSRYIRNFSMNPGATVQEMRFTWHSQSPTGILRITSLSDSSWYREIPTTATLGEIHGGVGAMGTRTNLLPIRPGYVYWVHQAAYYGLLPDTVYTWSAIGDDFETPAQAFRTGAGRDAGFQFIIAGDPQIGVGDGLTPTGRTEATVDGLWWAHTMDVAHAAFPDAGFVLTVGDQVHSANHGAPLFGHVAHGQYRHDRMFAPEALQSLPLIGVVGNHDGWSFNNDNANPRLWPLHYNINVPDIAGANTYVYVPGFGNVPAVHRYAVQFYTQFDYWVRWGNVFFIVLDANVRTMSGSRLAFFNRAVEVNADADWKVATFHHPPYCTYRRTGTGGPTANFAEKEQIINNWIPHFERVGIDIVLNGHAHVYNRTHQMYENIPRLNQYWIDPATRIATYGTVPTNAVLDPTGIVYFVFNSSSGSGYYNLTGMARRSYIAVYNQNFRRNFSVADVTPYSFSIRTYQLENDHGTVRTLVDVYTIVRSAEGAPGIVPDAVTHIPCITDAPQPIEFIVSLEPITRPHGVEKTVEGLGLPATVGVVTALANIVGANTANARPPSSSAYQAECYGLTVRPVQAEVNWNLDNLDFNPDLRRLQIFTVSGTLTLPRGVINPDAQPLTTAVQITVQPYGAMEPGAFIRWMAYGRPNPNPQNLPPVPGGMDYYFWSINTNGANVRVANLQATTPAGGFAVTGQTPIRFMVGDQQRFFNWDSGAPTVTTAVVGGATGARGVGDLPDAGTVMTRWETTINTQGRADIDVSFEFRSDPSGTGVTNNGPRDWELEASIDGVNWYSSNQPIVLTGVWNTLMRTLPPIANDQETVYLRWRMTSNIAVGGGTISTTARNHMRNIVITANTILGPDCRCLPHADCGGCWECIECACPPVTDCTCCLSADCCDNHCIPCRCNDPIRIDVLTFTDFHGHIEANEPDAANPGAARLTAFIEYQRNQNPNPNNVIVVGGGDEFHGYAVSTFLQGAPVVTMMNYLARGPHLPYNAPQSQSGMHVAFGNHEFSYGYAHASILGASVTLLAADLFYAPGHPRAGQQPDFVQPYDIIHFPDHDITIALVGLMTTGMTTLVSGWANMGLQARTPSSTGIGATTHTPAISALVDYLRNDRPAGYYGPGSFFAYKPARSGVDAVIGVTHLTGGGDAMTHVANNIDFDAIVGGHQHVRVQRTVNGVPIIEAQHHGRSLGRFSLYFDNDGNLENVTSWLSPVGAIQNFSGFAFNTVREHYDAMTSLMATYIYAPELINTRGPHGVYFSDRNQRDIWSSRLVLDHVTRWAAESPHADATDYPEGYGDFGGWVGISNSGGWRNTGLWPRNADDPVNLANLISTMPFSNNILLHRMRGQDLNNLLNTNPVRAGVHGSNNNWYVTATGQRIEAGTYFNVIGNNFTFGGLGAPGGDGFRWPGNNGGNAQGFAMIDGTQGPRVLMYDGSIIRWTELLELSTDNGDWESHGVAMIRHAMLSTTEFRGNNPREMWQAELTVRGVGGGTAVINNTNTAVAPGNRSRTQVIAPTWVTVEATGPEADFRGWFLQDAPPDAAPLATTMLWSFAIREDMAIEARFGDITPGDSVPVEIATWTGGNAWQLPTTSGLGNPAQGYGPTNVFSLPQTSGTGTASPLIFHDGVTNLPRPLSWRNTGINLRSPNDDSDNVTLNAARVGNSGWQTSFSTENISDITIAFELRSSNAGPRDFRLDYRVGSDGTWMTVDVNAAPLVTNIWAGTTRTLPETAQNQPLVYIRVTLASYFTAAGNTPANIGGNNGFRDLFISGMYHPGGLGDAPIDRTALQEAITAAQLRIQANYTTASWEIFYAALNTAIEVLADQNATQLEINEANAELRSAYAALIAAPPVVTVAEARLEDNSGRQVTVIGYVTGTTGNAANAAFQAVDASGPYDGINLSLANAQSYIGRRLEVTGYVRNIGGNLRMTGVNSTATGNNVAYTVLNNTPIQIAPIQITQEQALAGFEGVLVSVSGVEFYTNSGTGTQNHTLAGTTLPLRTNLQGFNWVVPGAVLDVNRAHVFVSAGTRVLYSTTFNEPENIAMTGFSNADRLTQRLPERTWNATVNGVGTLTTTTGSAEPGGAVTLTLDAIAGYNLTAVSVAGTDIIQNATTYNLTERTITFLMPSGTGDLDVIVTPLWAAIPPTFALTIQAGEGGTVSTTGGNFYEGALVTVTATANAGSHFVNWTAYGVTIDTTSATLSFDMPANAVTLTANFSQNLPTVTSVTVIPQSVQIQQGMTHQFGATVQGTYNPPQTVTWSVTGGNGTATIDPSGLLQIAVTETAGTILTVTATSTLNTSVFGTSIVTVTEIPPIINVTAVKVSPSAITINWGETYSFGAEVQGTNPPQGVTWTVEGGTAGTSISPSGVLTVGIEETSVNLTVRATSIYAPSISGTAAVTVIQPTPHIPVTNITGTPTTATVGTPLTLTGTVYPANATNKVIVWSVQDPGETGATLTDNMLHTTNAGTVVIRATIANGLTATVDFIQDFTITVNPVPVTYVTVTFVLNGGTHTGGGPLIQQIQVGGNAVAPITTRSNYIFSGWDRGFTNVQSDITVTALWTMVDNNNDTGDDDSGVTAPGPAPQPQPIPAVPTPTVPAVTPPTVPSAIYATVRVDNVIFGTMSIPVEELSTGEIIVEILGEVAEILIAQVAEQAAINGEDVLNVVTIDLSDIEQSVTVVFDAYAAYAFSNENITVELVFYGAKISLAPDNLAELAGINDDGTTLINVALTVTQGTTQELEAGQFLSVDVVVMVGDEIITEKIAEFTISASLESLDLAGVNTYRIVALFGNPTIVGGLFDTQTGIFTFNSQMTGEFAIVYVETLSRLAMQLDSPFIFDLANNAQTQIMDVLPKVQNDRTLVPIRFIAYALGAEVDWIESTPYTPLTVMLTLEGRTLMIPIGEVTQELAALGMDIYAQIINDRTMVPLRFVSEFFDALVEWDFYTRSIKIIRNTANLSETRTGENSETTSGIGFAIISREDEE